MQEIDRPAPGEALNTSDGPTVPRQAASVIVLRGGEQTLEVLLVRRTEQARFMAGVWVFPGGGVDAAEGEGDAAHRRAAVRELVEEAGIALRDAAGSELVKFSQWITPEEVQIRFDTHFFLASLPAGQEVVVDGEECVDHGWFTPQAALDAHLAGDILLVFPTIKHLEQLREFTTAVELLTYAGGRAVQAVQPRVLITGETARVLLPGEPGYDG